MLARSNGSWCTKKVNTKTRWYHVVTLNSISYIKSVCQKIMKVNMNMQSPDGKKCLQKLQFLEAKNYFNKNNLLFFLLKILIVWLCKIIKNSVFLCRLCSCRLEINDFYALIVSIEWFFFILYWCAFIPTTPICTLSIVPTFTIPYILVF